mmetsp:Transcript_37962/g.79512  ORF Transcript_37962/g.79512 Transcript_37962/m.79512 type:complete len:496 (+) Transcript_37962:298-1785(+)
MIPSSSFKKKFPNRSYKRFVASAMLRIILGYIFLLNVLLILVKADGVLDIFYDVLALQFISELDDIAFSLSKLDILGKSLRHACTAKLFQTEFERQKFARSIKASIFLKTVYFLNLAIFLGLMIQISTNQRKGIYQCNRIKVDFGDAVWADALKLSPEGGYNEVTLAFSTFNGVYENVRLEQGRPVYQEMKKFDRTPFDDWVIPAEIKYSKKLGAWIFNHPGIVKKATQDESEPWLLRSPDTEDFNLLNAPSEWNIWFGVIDTTHVTYSCTECDSNTDCNLNGNCVNGECECHVETVEEGGDGISYLGPHCEVKLKDKCGTIFDGSLNLTWSILRYTLPSGPEDVLFEEYNRPVYQLVSGADRKEDDIDWLVYTGSRWIYIGFNLQERNITLPELLMGVNNFHAFWSEAFSYDPTMLNLISDPTTSDTPVGVDWFWVTDWGDQYGPFGALTPLQEEIGMGVFRCAGKYDPARHVVNVTGVDDMNVTDPESEPNRQ